MTEKNETTNKIEAPVGAPIEERIEEGIEERTEEPIVEEGQLWNFTQDDFVVRAESLEEAQKIYKKQLTENKESNNG